MGKLRFYGVTDEYIDYCRQYDKKVPENKLENRKQTRKFIGVVLTINDKKYFAPLSSPKTKHHSMSDKVDFIKIDDKDGLYAVINLNNMIPVPDKAIVNFKFEEIDDRKYRDLLTKQFLICQKKKSKIIKSAEKLYKIVTVHKTANFVARSCNFTLLEEKCDTYVGGQVIN